MITIRYLSVSIEKVCLYSVFLFSVRVIFIQSRLRYAHYSKIMTFMFQDNNIHPFIIIFSSVSICFIFAVLFSSVFTVSQVLIGLVVITLISIPPKM